MRARLPQKPASPPRSPLRPCVGDDKCNARNMWAFRCRRDGRRLRVAEVDADPVTGELVERVDEVPAVAYGNDVSVLALCYGEGEQERACRFIAFALPERRGG